MGSALDRCAEQHRKDAVAELEAELAEFSHDGLVELQSDLAQGGVLRGSWAGCVISYKQGSAGSTRRDRMGRARNAFTVLWDNGWMTDLEVAAAVARELASRSLPAPREGGRSAERVLGPDEAPVPPIPGTPIPAPDPV